MARKRIVSSVLLLLFITEVEPQFFDFFGLPPIGPSTKFYNDYTTKRPKVETIKNIDHPTQISWKNTTISFIYEDINEHSNVQVVKEKKRKTTVLPIFNLNFFSTTTQKPIRKVNKVVQNRRNNTTNQRVSYDNSRLVDYNRNSNNKESNNRDSNNNKRTNNNNNKRVRLSYDVDVSKHTDLNNYYEKPINNLALDYNRPYYETTRNYDNNNYYTTKTPFFNRPGVKPAIIDNRPPITNKPVTKRPVTSRPISRPVTSRPVNIPATNRPVTNKPVTVRPYIVNPIPTDAGAIVFPHEDEQPQILRGPDEDYMSAAEKRRYIEIAEKMCDKYKALNTKQVQAIPLLPSPDPVQVNVSQCTPTTIPLVVGGKVVSINEFPHMALLGWPNIEGGGYSWKCGGSLISEQYVLTAGHCSYQERDNTVETGPPRVVQLGSSYLDDPGALVVRVGSVIRHPKYKMPRSYYDIALLKLVQPVTFSEVIRPACLGVPPPVDEPIIATGWGKTELGGDQSLELRSVSLPVWDINKCHEVLGTSRKMPDGPSPDSQMCAGEMRGGKDTCQGDSGGPAQIQDGCTWRVVAVTSLGRSCGAPNTPGLYALVHRAFIAAQVFGNNRNNRRTETVTTTTEPYYNRQQSGTQQSGIQQSDYSNQSGNDRRNVYEQSHRTDSYDYNKQQSDRNTYTNQQSGDRRTSDNNNQYVQQSGANSYTNQQSDYYNSKPQQSGFTNNNQRQNEHSTQQDYYSNNNRRNDYWGAIKQQNEYKRQSDGRNYDDGRIWWTR